MFTVSLEHLFRLGFSFVLGSLVGIEREINRKPAGLRTHTVISLASALFTILSVSGTFGDGAVDPTRIASQVVVGVGFVGAGVIISTGGQVRGVTTAASLWIAAAVGMASGLGEYMLALVTTLLTVIALEFFVAFEEPLKKRKG